jgi:hypothetical protein
MKRTLWLSAAVLLGWMTSSPAGAWCRKCCGDHCKDQPPPNNPNCCEPCDHGHHHCSCKKSTRAQKLIDDLCAEDCCTRIHAAKKLGHRCHADYCCNPEVLTALVKALLSDSCWEVRRAAAWSLAGQNARTEYALVALYVSSRTDAHYMVRARAAEAIDLLIICRKECYKRLFDATDALVTQLQIEKVRPGRDKADLIINGLDACCSAVDAPVMNQAPANNNGGNGNNGSNAEKMDPTPPDDQNGQK